MELFYKRFSTLQFSAVLCCSVENKYIRVVSEPATFVYRVKIDEGIVTLRAMNKHHLPLHLVARYVYRCVLRKLVLNMCAFILLVAMSYELFSSIFSLVHFHIFCSSSEFPTGLADVGIRDQQLFLALRNPTTQAKCCPHKMCAGKKNKFSRENAFTKLSCDIYGVYQGFIIHTYERQLWTRLL